MTPADLAAIRERANNATPGPWEADRPQVWGPNDESVAFVTTHDPGEGSGQPEWEANTVFIAHAREDIPALLDHVDQLRDTNARLHRRAQLAESAAMTTVEECRRQGVSLGRMLANSAARHASDERDQLAARLAAARELHKPDSLHQEMCAECSDFGTDDIPAGYLIPYPCATRRALDGDPPDPPTPTYLDN